MALHNGIKKETRRKRLNKNLILRGDEQLLKIIENVKQKYWEWQFQKEILNTEKTIEFIWGIKSYDDLSSSECNLYTMNDIDITYDKKEQKYYIGIETIYIFEDALEGEKKYIKQLFDALTEWMILQGYDTNKERAWIYEIFTEGRNINTGFNTIEELYVCFKILVNGFIHA